GEAHTMPGNDGISIEAIFKGEVTACADGTVVDIQTPGDLLPNGNTITIEHAVDDATYHTIYCHLFKVGVQPGQAVSAGEVIGKSDSSGSVIGSQLRLIVKKVGATEAGETEFTTPDGRTIKLMNDVVDPADYLNPTPEERFAERARSVTTFTDNVNLRRGPGTNFGVLGIGRGGDELEVLGVTEAGDWYQIMYKGQEAGAYAEYVDFIGNKSSLEVVEYVVTIPVQKPDFPLRGMHDGEPRYPDRDGAAEWMVKNNQRGWAVDMVYCLGADNLSKTYPEGHGHLHNTDYTYAERAGVKVILRWNYSFAKSEGGGGTFGDPSDDDRLIGWMARGIKNTKGVWGHIVGNEPNRAGENHDYGGQGNIGTPITPERIAKIVKGVKALVGPEHRISTPALDGTNTEAWFAYRKPIDIPNNYFSAILDHLEVGDIDWVALHGYSRGSKDTPENDAKFGNHPLEWQYFGFRMWEPFAQILREKGPDWERLPIVITETNHLKVGGEWNANHHNGWDNNDTAATWIRSAYEYIRNWNHEANDQYVHGLVLYRLSMDEWEIENKGVLLDALKNSGENPL
ncbi:MAG: peptidoglycan DD-metalloendopeptidase family protein, partial [Chloroflexota bacterium]